MSEEQTKAPETFTLHELAKRHGQLSEPVDGGSPYLVKHRVAASIHGWDAHDYHFQADPVRLTDAVYLEALESGLTSYEQIEAAVPVPPSAAELDARVAAEAARQAELNKTARQRKAEAEEKAAAEAEPTADPEASTESE